MRAGVGSGRMPGEWVELKGTTIRNMGLILMRLFDGCHVTNGDYYGVTVVRAGAGLYIGLFLSTRENSRIIGAFLNDELP